MQTPGESLSQPKKPCLAASDTVSTSTPQIILSEAVEFSDSNSFSEASTPSPMEVMPLSKSLITGNDTASSLLPVPESQYNRTDDQRLSSTGQFNGMHLRLPSGSVPSDSVEAESSVTSSSVPSNHPSLASISGGLFSDSFVSALMDQLTGDLTTLLQSNICHRLVDILKVASEARQRMRPSHQQACRPPPYVEGLVPSPASVDQAACVDLGSFATPSFASVSVFCSAFWCFNVGLRRGKPWLSPAAKPSRGTGQHSARCVYDTGQICLQCRRTRGWVKGLRLSSYFA